MAKKQTYDAGSISVLEGLEAVKKQIKSWQKNMVKDTKENNNLTK